MPAITRRTALQGLAGAAAANAAKYPGFVDAHVHFYDPGRPQGVPWPPKSDRLLYRAVLPADFEKVAGPFGAKGCVVIEASPWLEDNDWVANLATSHPVIRGYVGSLAPGTTVFADHFDRLAKNKIFRGIRLNETAIRSSLNNARAMKDLEKLSERGLTLDAIGSGKMLPDVAVLARRLPGLKIVIDHLPFAGADVAALAGLPHVYVKVSGEIHSSNEIDPLWKAFGAERLIFASNWPVNERYTSYDAMFSTVAAYFAAKGEEPEAQFFSRNAVAAYSLA